MLLNTIKPLQKFIIPDILNKTSHHNFSTGYIYGTSFNEGSYYTMIDVIITRKGKIGKPRASHSQIPAVSLFIPKMIEEIKGAYDQLAFVVTKSIIADVFSMDTVDFLSWAVAKYFMLENHSEYCKKFVSKEQKKPFKTLIDNMFCSETLPMHVITTFDKINARRTLVELLFTFEHFSREEFKQLYSSSDGIQVSRYLNAYNSVIKQNPNHFAPIKDIVKKASEENLNTVIKNLNIETANVLQKYENNSYWI